MPWQAVLRRHPDPEDRATLGCVFHSGFASQSFHSATNDREPDPRPFAMGLVGQAFEDSEDMIFVGLKKDSNTF